MTLLITYRPCYPGQTDQAVCNEALWIEKPVIAAPEVVIAAPEVVMPALGVSDSQKTGLLTE